MFICTLVLIYNSTYIYLKINIDIYLELCMVDRKEAEIIWNNSNRDQIRVMIPVELLEEINDKAVENWKLDRAARAKEITYRLLLAKECEEKNKKQE